MANIQNVYRLIMKRVFFYTSLAFLGILTLGLFYGYALVAIGRVELGNESLMELLINNEKCILLLALGTCTLGIYDVISLAVNAGTFGYIIGMAFHQYGWMCLLRLLPHAFLEIPAILAGGVAGLSIPITIYIYHQIEHLLRRKTVFLYVFKRSVIIILLAAMLMVISCFIEFNVSMKITI